MNKIWNLLLFTSLIFFLVNGKLNDLGDIIVSSSIKTWNIFLEISLLMLFWSGIFQIAIDSNLIDSLTKLLIKPLSILFPELDKEGQAIKYISANFLANILGLGAAATPLGLMAFKAMQEENKTDKVTNDYPSRSMLTFLAINVSSLTIIPTNIISLRSTYEGSTDINLIIMMILSTLISTIIAVVLDRLFYYGSKKWKLS
jgi:spore maturation protein A